MKESRTIVYFRARGVAALVVTVLALLIAPPASVAQEKPSNLETHWADREAYPSDTTVIEGWIAPEELALLQSEQYTSPLVIPAAAFGADGGNPDSFFFPFGGGYMQGDSQEYGCLMAPAYLPDGVTVTEMWVTTYDNDPAFDLLVDLRRVDNFVGGTIAMAGANTLGELDEVQVIADFSINQPLVVYPDYSYYVTTCVLSGSLRIYSVRLYYTTP